jgi:hypothetical protein
MYSILTVTTEATTYDLTELSDVKDELSLKDGNSDATLKRYISSASLAAMQYCNRTFAVETLSEQFFADPPNRMVRGGVKVLQLARWPLIAGSVVVTEDGVLLVENTDYLVDKTNGQLTHLDVSGLSVLWHPLPLTVAYQAGYATTPVDVEDAIIKMVTRRFSAKGRDPNLKQQSIPGVIEQQWWIATGTESGNMSPDITDVLDNYRAVIVS